MTHEHAWWLDSSLEDGNSGRFSYMGSAAGPLSRIAVADGSGTRLRGPDGVERRIDVEILDFLREDLAEHAEGLADLDLGFTLGWVGYMDYELGTRMLLEPRSSAGGSDEAVFVFADRAIAIDHHSHEAWILGLGDASFDPGSWIEETKERLERGHWVPDASVPVPLVQADLVTSRHARTEYLRLIEHCLALIALGESYELCLTNQIEVAVATPSWPLYQRLRRSSPKPYGAYLAFGQRHLLSASPERLLRVSADGKVESKPIKGTRPRGCTPDHDRELRQELAGNPKDRAENLMIVDLVRNDLGRVCGAGSVGVSKLFDVETYAGVHQLVSTIHGTLAQGQCSTDALRAVFPGGSMTGAPKERSVSLLRAMEGGPRGIYSGAAGYFSLNGTADWSIVIRSIVWQPDRLTYGVGGAIIALSDPVEEWQETLVKARTFGTTLGIDLDKALDPDSA